jgi:hypothetical protein
MGDMRPKPQYEQRSLAFMTEGRGESPEADREGTETPTAKRDPDEFLLPTAFDGLASGPLFYPSAGDDIELPIKTFAPWIRDFWFVDKCYDLNSRNYDPNRLFGRRHQLVSDEREILTGTTLRNRTPFEIEVRHERYWVSGGVGLVTIHRCQGHGYNAFRTVFKDRGLKIAVFFHRGDSPGEGGSNFFWLGSGRRLGSGRLENVLDCLELGGLVVSDGSLAMPQFSWSGPETRITADDLPPPFECLARRLHCVGHLGHRYGPTLVWKVSEA